VTVVVVASDGGRPSMVASDGGEQRWKTINCGEQWWRATVAVVCAKVLAF